MKVTTQSNIIFLLGGLAALPCTILAFMLMDKDPNLTLDLMIFALLFIIAGFLGAQDNDRSHIIKILKKKGLWEDNPIKKEDLPK